MTHYNGNFTKSWTSGVAVAGSRKFAGRAVPAVNQLLGGQDLCVLLLDCEN